MKLKGSIHKTEYSKTLYLHIYAIILLRNKALLSVSKKKHLHAILFAHFFYNYIQ